MIQGKNIEHRPITELMSIVRRDLKRINELGLIDDGSYVKTIMYCNEQLGVPVRDIREICIPIENHKGRLPLDFEKFYYACIKKEGFSTPHKHRDPFDNKMDADVIYEAKVASGKFGQEEKTIIEIKRDKDIIITSLDSWTHVDVAKHSYKYCFRGCPAFNRGLPTITIEDDNTIETTFKTGFVYVIYVANMKDEEGRLLFPFHPKITPYYEWCVKEQIMINAIFNSEGQIYGELLKIAKQERALAWIDAFNSTQDKAFGAYAKMAREKELKWYNQYFKHFK